MQSSNSDYYKSQARRTPLSQFHRHTQTEPKAWRPVLRSSVAASLDLLRSGSDLRYHMSPELTHPLATVRNQMPSKSPRGSERHLVDRVYFRYWPLADIAAARVRSPLLTWRTWKPVGWRENLKTKVIAAQTRQLRIALRDLIANDQGTGHANLRHPRRATLCDAALSRRGTSDAGRPCEHRRDFSIFSNRSRLASSQARPQCRSRSWATACCSRTCR